MHSKLHFSLATILLAITVIAILVFVPNVWRMRTSLMESERRVQQHEAKASLRRQRLEKEFFGFHGDPVLAVDIPNAKAKLWLFRILNSKNSGQHVNLQDGNGRSSGGLLMLAATREADDRRVGINVRLLRSLDGHDYYRLVYHPNSYLDGKNRSADGGQKTLLFQYDGQPNVLVKSESIVIAIGDDRDASLQAVLGTYPAEEAAAKRAEWMDGPYKPTVETIFHPAVRSAGDRQSK